MSGCALASKRTCLTCAAAARSSSTCSWSPATRPWGGSRRCPACWLRPRRRCQARRGASPGAGAVRVLSGFSGLPPSSLLDATAAQRTAARLLEQRAMRLMISGVRVLPPSSLLLARAPPLPSAPGVSPGPRGGEGTCRACPYGVPQGLAGRWRILNGVCVPCRALGLELGTFRSAHPLGLKYFISECNSPGTLGQRLGHA